LNVILEKTSATIIEETRRSPTESPQSFKDCDLGMSEADLSTGVVSFLDGRTYGDIANRNCAKYSSRDPFLIYLARAF
jgi:hypothetical protein